MNRPSFRIVLAGLAAFILGQCGFFSDLAVDPAKTPSVLGGRVVDSLSGAGMAGASVVLKGESVHETVTGADGAFRFPDLFTGEKKLEISTAYYRSCSMGLTLTEEGVETLTVRMVRQNNPPVIVRTVYPAGNSTDIPLTMRFKWEVSDPDFAARGSREILFYVLTMDTGSGLKDSGFLSAPASGTTLLFRAPVQMITGLKSMRVYHWRLSIRDCFGATSVGEDSFTTRPKFPSEDSICPQGMVFVETEGVPAFCMDKYEMTNTAYDTARMDDDPDWGQSVYSIGPSRPATKVVPIRAGLACLNLNKRLCRADEWIAAAAGWEDWSYPYGSEYDGAKCNTEKPAFQSIPDGGGADTAGQHGGCVSPFGIYDLSGNVAEWVAYSNLNPFPPDSLNYRTYYYIGGSWSSRENSGINSKKFIKTGSPTYSQDDIGFRCCKDPQGGF